MNCDGACLDVNSDNDHCGDCGIKCDVDKGFSCVAGACACHPSRIMTDCDGECVNTNIDSRHCGACGSRCADGEYCRGGGCGGCAGSPLNICCDGTVVDTTSDPNNCGECYNSCDTTNTGKVCIEGKCVCPEGLTDCDGQCVDLQTNGFHCGACDCVCGPGEACLAGTCHDECPFWHCAIPGCTPTKCGGDCTICVDINESANHCGGCDQPCTGGSKVCSSGVCACPSSKPDECGVCVDLQTDDNNCGDCAIACSSGKSCVAGVCCAPWDPSLTVDCPDTVACGGSVQCTAWTVLPSGAIADVTDDPGTTWTAILQLGTCTATASEGQLSVTCPPGMSECFFYLAATYDNDGAFTCYPNSPINSDYVTVTVTP